MAKFKFKMDFLIKLRQRKEEEAMLRLAKRLASIRDLEHHLAAMFENKETLARDLSEKIKEGRVTAPLLSLYTEYQARLAREISRAEELLRLSRKEEAKDRAALAKASVDKQVIEKLKEKQKAEFRAEELYLEQNNLEELAALAKSRRDRLEAASPENNHG